MDMQELVQTFNSVEGVIEEFHCSYCEGHAILKVTYNSWKWNEEKREFDELTNVVYMCTTHTQSFELGLELGEGNNLYDLEWL